MLNFIGVLVILICLSILCVMISNGACILKKAQGEGIVSKKSPTKHKRVNKVKRASSSPYPSKHAHISRKNSLPIRYTGRA